MSYGYGGMDYGSGGGGGGYGGSGGGGYAPPGGAPPGYGSRNQGPGGFATHRPAGPPPGADPQLWQWFTSVDADNSGAITAQELQQCLINGDWTPFDLDTVKLLMSIFDTDRSGTIGFNEFAGLWKYIKDWQGVFRHFDRDRSGTIDGPELDQALSGFGYHLNPSVKHLLLAKYDISASETIPARGSGPPPGITFDRFVRACVVVRTLTETFERLAGGRNGWAQLNYDGFMQAVLAAP